MTAETKKRLARNQTLFREVNERIMEMYSNGEAVEFVCECSDPECATTVRMSPDDYAHVRAASVRFLVIPGHEVLEIERVVSREDGYVTVENQVQKDHVDGTGTDTPSDGPKVTRERTRSESARGSAHDPPSLVEYKSQPGNEGAPALD